MAINAKKVFTGKIYFPPNRVEPSTKFSKKGEGLTGPQLFERVAGKEGVTFFRGSRNVHQKNKNLKYLMTKIFFSVITKNSN